MDQSTAPSRLDWRSLAFLVPTAAHLLFRLTNTAADPDLWRHLYFGRLFAAGAEFPWGDVSAYVPTKDPWIVQSWLCGVLFFSVFQAWGGEGIQALKYGLGLATGWLAYLAARLDQGWSRLGEGSSLRRLLRAEPGWRLEYADAGALLYAREGGPDQGE